MKSGIMEGRGHSTLDGFEATAGEKREPAVYNSLMEIKEKVVIVTGASGGIGLATAILLARHGARVALVARSRDRLEEAASELLYAIAVPADMTKRDEIGHMVKTVRNHFGRIDILVNNAGQGYDAPVERTNMQTFRHILDLDLIGPLIAMQLVIPIMREQGGGQIVNISSGLALMYLPNMSPYSAAKRALGGISLTAREELKKDHIAVGVVYPYITCTDFEKNTIRETPEEEEPESGGPDQPPAPDNAEFVAQKILECIESEAAEVFAHDWMKGRPPLPVL